MTLNFDLQEKYGNELNKKVNLSNYSWFNLGGEADYLFKAKNKIQLIEFLKDAKKNNINLTFLGAGSNTLFRDNGVKAVVKLVHIFHIKIIDKNIIDVGAATDQLANFAKDNNLGNLEFLSCIPGLSAGR